MNETFFARLYEYCEGNIEIRPIPGKQGFFPLERLEPSNHIV